MANGARGTGRVAAAQTALLCQAPTLHENHDVLHGLTLRRPSGQGLSSSTTTLLLLKLSLANEGMLSKS